MKRKSKVYYLILIILFTGTSIYADQIHSREESPAYPKGYYTGDMLPEKTAYLTFDDGPAEWTGSILDTLKKEDVKATFFVCAYWNNRQMKGLSSFQKHTGSLQRIVKEGHVLGNHTYGHDIIPFLSPEKIRQQFNYNQILLNKALGEDAPEMTIIRMPQGQPWSVKSSESRKKYTGSIVRDLGIVAMWTKEADSTDSWDWAKGEWYKSTPKVDRDNPSFIKKRDRVYKRVLLNADGRGIVILMHDTHLVTSEVLPAVIKELKGRGYRFDTMEDFVMWKYGKSSKELIRTK
ncbi:MAG: polysaccharide deacetylase [Spirochaetae bacterium HGW-Spirochaetae-5]|nr:MAG: polysaccharide deacetylase [Spirochaetae bacterium HGW-Spirochaetae-5]